MVRLGGAPAMVPRGQDGPKGHRWRENRDGGRDHLRRISAKLRRGRGSGRGNRARGEAWARGGALEELGRGGIAAGARADGRSTEQRRRGGTGSSAPAELRGGGG